jgi:DNA-binding NarL/FixJ family response regulator
MSARGTIVIVEDEWLVARAVERMLTRAGYTVAAAVAREADVLPALARHAPDAVVLDVHLDRPNAGLRVAEQLAASAGPPWLFLTAVHDRNVFAKAASVAPCAYVAKPFSESQLVVSLDTLLSHVRAQRGRAEGAAAAVAALQRVAAVLVEAGVTPSGGVPREPRRRKGSRWALLSAREREVAEALVARRSVARVAAQLSISPHTVRNHLKSMFAKLGVHSQDELIDALDDGRS